MPKIDAINLRGLLAVLLLSCSGCVSQQWCQLPDDFVHAFNQTQLGWELQDVFHSCSSGSCSCEEGIDNDCDLRVYDDVVCLEEPAPVRRRRIEVGPPPVRYEPPMPPKFLPVPARSVF